MARVAIWNKNPETPVSRIFAKIRDRWTVLGLIFAAVCSGTVSHLLVVHGHHPPVGVYIAVMGAVAALMVFHEQPNKWEKAAWLILIIVLMVAEIRNIYATDKEQSNTFHKISDDLDTTKTGLEATQHGIEAAANKIQETVTGVNVLYSEATGGDSYFYFDIAFVGGPIGLEIPGGPQKGAMVVGTIPKFVGKYPLPSVYLAQFGPLGHGPDIDYGTIFPNELGRPRQTPQPSFFPDQHKKLFFFFINAANGSYEEIVIIKKFGEKWLWACRLYKRRNLIRSWAVSEFPKELIKADWDKVD